jgi:HEAT repeat protein
VRRIAVEALVKLGDPRAVEPLAAALGDSDSALRWTAAGALGELGDPRAVKPLAAALGDSYWEVRRIAVEALGKLGDPRAVEPLVAALKDSYWDVRWHAAAALTALGWKPADAGQRARFAIARDRFDDAVAEGPVAVEPLVAALGDKSFSGWRRRPDAAEALGKLGDRRAVEPLAVALGECDIVLQKCAVEALGKLGDPRAVEPLAAMLKDSNWEVQRSAAEALGELCDLRAVEFFVAALRNSDKGVRSTAVAALAALGWKPADASQRVVLAIARGRYDDAVAEGVSAVEPLIEISKSDEDEAENAIRSLQLVLKLAAERVHSETLISISNLHVWKVVYRDSCGSRTKRELLDCSGVKQLARQELIRRGIEA